MHSLSLSNRAVYFRYSGYIHTHILRDTWIINLRFYLFSLILFSFAWSMHFILYISALLRSTCLKTPAIENISWPLIVRPDEYHCTKGLFVSLLCWISSISFPPSLTCQPIVCLNTSIILHPNDEICKHLQKTHYLLCWMRMLASVKYCYTSSSVMWDDI